MPPRYAAAASPESDVIATVSYWDVEDAVPYKSR